MKRQVLICLSLVVLFVGTQASHLHSSHHTPDLPQPKLLQTKAATEVEAAATATAATATATATGTGTETDCEPECLYKFPYLDSECDEEKPPVPEPPTPEPPKNKTFIEEAEGCYYFNLTVTEEPPKTFVEEYRGCYNFTDGIIVPPPDHTSDESCDEPSVIYRYPFIHEGEDCNITTTTDEEEEPIILYNTTGDYEEPLPIEEWITVAEDGETTIYTTYEGEEIISYPNGTTTIIINEDSEILIHTYDESGEEIVPIPPVEELEYEQGGETILPPTLEHGEEFVIIYQECYQYTENEDGEVVIVNEEFTGYYTEEIPPQVVVEINEDGEMIVLSNTEGSYTEEIPTGEPSFNIETGEGVTETRDTSGEVTVTIEGETKITTNEDTFTSDDTYDTSCTVIHDLEGEIQVITNEGKEEEFDNLYDTSGEVIITLTGETEVITNEGGETGDTYDTSGEVIITLTGETEVITNEGGEIGETYDTSGEWSIPIPSGEVIITENEGQGGEQPPVYPEECIIIRDTYSSGTTIIYGQPTTYITYNTIDIDNHHSVSYTYVLTNIYSGIFKTNEYDFVIYGAGAVNFYNTYYGIDARVHDTPSCSCTCGYQTYTFTYSFGF